MYHLWLCAVAWVRTRESISLGKGTGCAAQLLPRWRPSRRSMDDFFATAARRWSLLFITTTTLHALSLTTPPSPRTVPQAKAASAQAWEAGGAGRGGGHRHTKTNSTRSRPRPHDRDPCLGHVYTPPRIKIARTHAWPIQPTQHPYSTQHTQRETRAWITPLRRGESPPSCWVAPSRHPTPLLPSPLAARRAPAARHDPEPFPT